MLSITKAFWRFHRDGVARPQRWRVDAKETRDRIMKAVEEMGYVLDHTAGSLSSKRTGFVVVLS